MMHHQPRIHPSPEQQQQPSQDDDDAQSSSLQDADVPLKAGKKYQSHEGANFLREKVRNLYESYEGADGGESDFIPGGTSNTKPGLISDIIRQVRERGGEFKHLSNDRSWVRSKERDVRQKISVMFTSERRRRMNKRKAPDESSDTSSNTSEESPSLALSSGEFSTGSEVIDEVKPEEGGGATKPQEGASQANLLTRLSEKAPPFYSKDGSASLPLKEDRTEHEEEIVKLRKEHDFEKISNHEDIQATQKAGTKQQQCCGLDDSSELDKFLDSSLKGLSRTPSFELIPPSELEVDAVVMAESGLSPLPNVASAQEELFQHRRKRTKLGVFASLGLVAMALTAVLLVVVFPNTGNEKEELESAPVLSAPSAPTISRHPTPKPTFGVPTASPLPTSPSAVLADPPVPTLTVSNPPTVPFSSVTAATSTPRRSCLENETSTVLVFDDFDNTTTGNWTTNKTSLLEFDGGYHSRVLGLFDDDPFFFPQTQVAVPLDSQGLFIISFDYYIVADAWSVESKDPSYSLGMELSWGDAYNATSTEVVDFGAFKSPADYKRVSTSGLDWLVETQRVSQSIVRHHVVVSMGSDDVPLLGERRQLHVTIKWALSDDIWTSASVGIDDFSVTECSSNDTASILSEYTNNTNNNGTMSDVTATTTIAPSVFLPSSSQDAPALLSSSSSRILSVEPSTTPSAPASPSPIALTTFAFTELPSFIPDQSHAPSLLLPLANNVNAPSSIVLPATEMPPRTAFPSAWQSHESPSSLHHDGTLIPILVGDAEGNGGVRRILRSNTEDGANDSPIPKNDG